MAGVTATATASDGGGGGRDLSMLEVRDGLRLLSGLFSKENAGSEEGSINVLDVDPASDSVSELDLRSRNETLGMKGFGDTFGTLLNGMGALVHTASVLASTTK